MQRCALLDLELSDKSDSAAAAERALWALPSVGLVVLPADLVDVTLDFDSPPALAPSTGLSLGSDSTAEPAEARHDGRQRARYDASSALETRRQPPHEAGMAPLSRARGRLFRTPAAAHPHTDSFVCVKKSQQVNMLKCYYFTTALAAAAVL